MDCHKPYNMPLFLIFVAIPIIEIMLLLRVNEAIGFPSTFALVIITAVIGSYLWRTEGRRTLSHARAKLAQGEFPSSELIQGILIGAGGLLLLTPGFATDLFGFLCLLPFTRRRLAQSLASKGSRFVHSPGAQHSPFQRPADPFGKETSGGRIIEGETVNEDETKS